MNSPLEVKVIETIPCGSWYIHIIDVLDLSCNQAVSTKQAFGGGELQSVDLKTCAASGKQWQHLLRLTGC